jgi:hypothetical protein
MESGDPNKDTTPVSKQHCDSLIEKIDKLTATMNKMDKKIDCEDRCW